MITTGTLYDRDVKMFADRPANVYDMLAHSAKQFPAREALVKEQTRLTYQELKAAVDVVACNLRDQNINKGDRIAILLGNDIEFVLTTLACAKIGAIFVPLNTKLTASDLIFMLMDSAPKILITNQELFQQLEDWMAGSSLIQTCILVDAHPGEGIHSFESLLMKEAKSQVSDYTEPDVTDPLYIMYTSGTTGMPKGAVGSHINVIHSSLSYKYVLNTNHQDSTVIAVPLFHVTGLVGQLFHMLLVGGTSVLMHRYSTEPYLKLISTEAITFLFNVPTIYVMMMAHSSFKDYQYSSVRIIAYGGAPMSKETIKKLKSNFLNATMHNAYGATETTSPTTIMPKIYPDEKVSSVGLPVPVADLMIVNQDGQQCGPAEMGELYIKGPMVIKEYWNNKEANINSFYEGYWKSGDVAYIDQDGFVYIMDRIKDMINRGGEKIYSIEIENVLYSHPKVLEASVIGINDHMFGEEVKAFIVKMPDADLTKEEILAFARRHLSEYKVPKFVEFITELPRNPGGKILKKKLVELSKTSENNPSM